MPQHKGIDIRRHMAGFGFFDKTQPTTGINIVG